MSKKTTMMALILTVFASFGCQAQTDDNSDAGHERVSAERGDMLGDLLYLTSLYFETQVWPDGQPFCYASSKTEPRLALYDTRREDKPFYLNETGYRCQYAEEGTKEGRWYIHCEGNLCVRVETDPCFFRFDVDLTIDVPWNKIEAGIFSISFELVVPEDAEIVAPKCQLNYRVQEAYPINLGGNDTPKNGLKNDMVFDVSVLKDKYPQSPPRPDSG